MSINNLWPQISPYATPAESQLVEGGGANPQDRFWNCVYTTVSVCLQVLGYPDIEPEDLRNAMHPGVHHSGGETFDAVRAFLMANSRRWPNLPRIDVWNPADTIGTLQQMLAKGYLTIFDVYDDGNGNVLNHAVPQGYTHAVLLEAQGATKTTIWNPWHGEQSGQTFDKSFIKAATFGPYVGNLMVFARNIVAPAPAPPPAPVPLPAPAPKPAPVPPPIVVVPPVVQPVVPPVAPAVKPPAVVPPVLPPVAEIPHIDTRPWWVILLDGLARLFFQS